MSKEGWWCLSLIFECLSTFFSIGFINFALEFIFKKLTLFNQD